MDDEIELISDGDGLAVIGSRTAVERFLDASGLSSQDLGPRLSAVLGAGAGVAQKGAELAADSGRWVQLTEDSARVVGDYGLMPTKTPGVSHAMIGKPGDIQQWIQIAKGPGAALSNPALLSGAAGVMAQLAMQQAMAEITDYLARIDEKLDDVIRSQTNQVLARMDGVAFALDEAMSVRESVGRVSEITWSKVQSSSGTILETQAYALRQIGDLAEKFEKKSKIDDLAKASKEAETAVQKWLAVLARCLQLHDAMAVLELDRVLDASPDEIDPHRLGLKAARRDRLQLTSQTTERLLQRMEIAAGTANSKVLFNPIQSPAVVKASNRVAVDVHEFHRTLGIESGRESAEARPWADAAVERWEKVRETGAEGIGVAKDLGSETRERASSVKDRLSGRLAERKLRRHKEEEGSGE